MLRFCGINLRSIFHWNDQSMNEINNKLGLRHRVLNLVAKLDMDLTRELCLKEPSFISQCCDIFNIKWFPYYYTWGNLDFVQFCFALITITILMLPLLISIQCYYVFHEPFFTSNDESDTELFSFVLLEDTHVETQQSFHCATWTDFQVWFFFSILSMPLAYLTDPFSL
jgi:hypothetical protein